MLYSVIIPAYNRAAFLPRAVRSVLGQDGVDRSLIQAVVIDDGSSDNTESVMRGLEGPNVKYIRIAHVGEPGSVRNVGLDAADGEFIAYCDSDDYWLPHHLATAAQRFKKRPHLGMVSNFWALAHFEARGGEIATQIVVPPHPADSVNTNCRVHRRSCIERVGRFNQLKWGEDQDFFQRIERAFPCEKTFVVSSVNGYIRKGNNLTYQFDAGVKGRYF